MNVKVPASAPTTPPETGASTERCPAATASAAASRASSTLMVEQSRNMVSGAAAVKQARLPAGSLVRVQHVPAAGKHGQYHGRACHGLGGCRRGGYPVRPGGVQRCRHHVKPDHGVTGVDEVDGHGPAHVAQAQERDGAIVRDWLRSQTWSSSPLTERFSSRSPSGAK